MKPARYKLSGVVLPAPNHTAVWLTSADSPHARPLWLALALTVRGSEAPILPALVVDDYGHEIAGKALYDWLHTEGDSYPRATVYGYDPDGSETECFVRALELHWKAPCLLYTQRHTPVADGVPVRHLLVTDERVAQPTPIKPAGLALPAALRRARVGWWAVADAEMALSADFSLLSSSPHPS
jgi:hypothetical protein